MHDAARDRATALIFQRLADPEFRYLLTAAAPDGSHPLFIALASDPVETMLEYLDSVGGAGNIVIPYLNGVVVLAVTPADPGDLGVTEPEPLTGDCTVGLFAQRVQVDGDNGVYRFMFDHAGHTDAATAELVAIAG
jgi:hypothetical protein